MPGFFNTQNPTPWAKWTNPTGAGTAAGAGGLSPATLAPQTGGMAAPAPLPAPVSAPAPAPAPAAPVPAPAAPAAPAPTQPLPFGNPGTGAFDTTPWGSLPPDQMQAVWAAWEAAGKPGGGLSPMEWYNSGGYQQPVAGGGSGPTPPVPLGGQLGAMLGARFPGQPPAFSGTDKNGGSLFSFLPGRAGEAEGIGQFLANWLAGQATEQRPRSNEMENLFRMVQAQGANSPFLGLANTAAAGAQDRLGAGSMDALRNALTNTATSTAAMSRNNQMNQMRDLGLLGQGAASQGVVGGIENRAASGLGQALRDIEIAMSNEYGNRLGQAGDLARGGAGVQESMLNAPSYNLAQTLGQQKYGGDQPLLNLLQDMMYTAIQGDVASRSQPSGFEKIGVPLLSGAMSGASGIGDLLNAIKGVSKAA